MNGGINVAAMSLECARIQVSILKQIGKTVQVHKHYRRYRENSRNAEQHDVICISLDNRRQLACVSSHGIIWYITENQTRCKHAASSKNVSTISPPKQPF